MAKDRGRKTTNAIYICGGDYRPQARGDCPNALHDWPLPQGYGEADEVAHARLHRRWRNKQCPDCNLYGWVPGEQTAATHAVRVTVSGDEVSDESDC